MRARVENGVVESIGLTCASWHSTVDDSVLPGTGRRLDGHSNDGSAATFADVVEHYNSSLHLGLARGQKRDLVEYLKSH